MKNRTFKVLNFFAFNVLFFAIYLNFIHKDVNALPAVSASATVAKSGLSHQVNTSLQALEQPKEKSAEN